MPQINLALSWFGKWVKTYHQCLYSSFTIQAFLCMLQSLSQKLFMSLSPFSKGCTPPSLSLSLHPSIDLSFPLYATILASLCFNPPTPPSMCYSNIVARTQCFSMPLDRQSITAWLSLSIGSEPLLAQP